MGCFWQDSTSGPPQLMLSSHMLCILMPVALKLDRKHGRNEAFKAFAYNRVSMEG